MNTNIILNEYKELAKRRHNLNVEIEYSNDRVKNDELLIELDSVKSKMAEIEKDCNIRMLSGEAVIYDENKIIATTTQDPKKIDRIQKTLNIINE